MKKTIIVLLVLLGCFAITSYGDMFIGMDLGMEVGSGGEGESPPSNSLIIDGSTHYLLIDGASHKLLIDGAS
jgi:hypothetical protein